MESLGMALVMVKQAMVEEAHSALPDAPVIAPVDTVSRSLRARVAFAGGLRRLADAVASQPSGVRAPVRQTLCTEAGCGVQG